MARSSPTPLWLHDSHTCRVRRLREESKPSRDRFFASDCPGKVVVMRPDSASTKGETKTAACRARLLGYRPPPDWRPFARGPREPTRGAPECNRESREQIVRFVL